MNSTELRKRLGGIRRSMLDRWQELDIVCPVYRRPGHNTGCWVYSEIDLLRGQMALELAAADRRDWRRRDKPPWPSLERIDAAVVERWRASR